MFLFGVLLSITAALPPLIPRNVLFGNPRWAPKISPDGAHIAYLAPDEKGVENIWVRSVGKNDDRLVTHDRRGFVRYDWVGSDRLVFVRDSDGDENFHCFLARVDGAPVRDLTPFEGVRATDLLISRKRPNEIVVAMNLRDLHEKDLYRIDLESGAIEHQGQSPGDVLSWTADADLVVRGATALEAGSLRTVLRVRDAADQPWRDLAAWNFEDATQSGQDSRNSSIIAAFTPDGSAVDVVSARTTDRAAIVRIDLKTGKETTLLYDPEREPALDYANGVRPWVFLHPTTGALLAAAFEGGDFRWHFLDDSVRADFERIERAQPGFAYVLNSDSANSKWVVEVEHNDGPQRFFLYDRATKALEPLYVDQPELEKYSLATPKPITIRSRDGLQLPAYVTLPVGLPPKNLPMVLLVHGGPWERDHWGYDPEVQLYANRGYAVLQVNYRGSTGFGKAYLNAGNHQFGRGTQNDLADAVAWAIREGIADPKRVAISGGSGGGYSALRGVTETPEVYACAVAHAAPFDFALLYSQMPPHWKAIKGRWIRRFGDPEHDAELNKRLSPLYHVDRIRVPVFIAQGANDVRVGIDQAELMVKAMRAQKLEPEYVVYTDEGHGLGRPETLQDQFGRIERFLSKCIGGRAEEFKPVTGANVELR